MEQTNTVFIVDLYNKFCSDKVVATFLINGRWFAIKEVELLWGTPQLSSVEEAAESPYFKLYNTEEEARAYIRQIKQLEGARF